VLELVITGTTALAVTVRVAVPAPVVLLALRVTKIVPGAFGVLKSIRSRC